jgi:hypothetical protein
MIKFTLIFPFLLFGAICFSQSLNDAASYLENKHNKQLIKKNKIETVIIRFKPEDFASSKHKITFDSTGNTKEYTIYRNADTPAQSYFYTYDEYGGVTLRTQKNFENGKTDSVHYFLTYERGKLISDSSSQLPIKNYYKYNKAGFVTDILTTYSYGVGNSFKGKIAKTLNSSGTTTALKEIRFTDEKDSVGYVFSNYIFRYNKKGILLSQQELIKTENRITGNNGSVLYRYNNVSDLIEIKQGKSVTFSFSYYENRLIKSKSSKIIIDGDTFETSEHYTYTFRKNSFTSTSSPVLLR